MLEQDPALEPSANGWWNEGQSTPTMGGHLQAECDKTEQPAPAEQFDLPGNPYDAGTVVPTFHVPVPSPNPVVSQFPVANGEKRGLPQRMVNVAPKGKRSEMESSGSVSDSERRPKTDKRKLRLERNRKCAKESRRKKKEYIQGIEGEVLLSCRDVMD
ncbi:MAG: hypothetical protein P4L10_14180 [Acidobacteriaceae bacterium]|nr:hypothetical protein [Acidobacteriaceae bacterium]